MKKNISLSILDSKNKEADILQVRDITEKIKDIYDDAFEYIVHFDVMDNKFVPNVGIDLEYVKIARKHGIYSDVHLMVEKPIEDGYIDKAIEYGASRISIHYEIENFEKVLKYLSKYNVDIGIVVKPGTDVKNIEKYINRISNLLIMSVEPGFGGQKYITKVNDKVKYIREKYQNLDMQVDGGVDLDTIVKPLELGVTSFVVGSYITKSQNLYSSYISLNIAKSIVECYRTENIDFTKTILQIVEGGYAKDDILLGVKVPDIRKIAKKWYKYIDYDVIALFLKSNIHEFRQFAIFCLTYMNNKDKKMYDFIKENISRINNWDLTDIVGPNILGKFLVTKEDNLARKQIQELLQSDEIWIKRIGIVILLEYAKMDKLNFVLDNIEDVIYEEYHLFQKATGWVIREVYKKDRKLAFDYIYIHQRKRKLPNILLSYACEKMSKEEKEKIRSAK